MFELELWNYNWDVFWRTRERKGQVFYDKQIFELSLDPSWNPLSQTSRLSSSLITSIGGKRKVTVSREFLGTSCQTRISKSRSGLVSQFFDARRKDLGWPSKNDTAFCVVMINYQSVPPPPTSFITGYDPIHSLFKRKKVKSSSPDHFSLVEPHVPSLKSENL